MTWGSLQLTHGRMCLCAELHLQKHYFAEIGVFRSYHRKANLLRTALWGARAAPETVIELSRATRQGQAWRLSSEEGCGLERGVCHQSWGALVTSVLQHVT